MLHAIETVRSGMPSARQSVYLNAGTWGPLPTRAADAMRARVERVESRGRIGSAGYEEFQAIRDAARSAFAESLGSDPARIALTHSTSGAMNLVLGGLAFAPGEEIVTTDNEHAGLLEPLAALGRRYGVDVRVAEALRNSDPLDAIASLIGPRTRVVALSHVLWANGRVLPMREISEAAHAVGASVLADGAQGVGALDVDPAALGVDAAVAFRRELVGWTEGAAQMAAVRSRCVELLAEVPGVTLQADSEGAGPLVAFSVAGKSAEDVVAALEKDGVLGRSLPDLEWVRVSLGYWVSDGDLQRLADSLRSLAQ
jgi:selenocysteine lyase/cysteine desulfurase